MKALLKCKTCGEEKWFGWWQDDDTNAAGPNEDESFDCKCDFDFDVLEVDFHEDYFPDDVF